MMKLLESLTGAGQLLFSGRSVPVRYTIHVYQEMRDAGRGCVVPGVLDRRGEVQGLSLDDWFVLNDGDNAAELVLNDGRRADVTVNGSTVYVNGDFKPA